MLCCFGGLPITRNHYHVIKTGEKDAATASVPTSSQSYRGKIPTIRCVCGAQILVVPDLKAMSNAIENHIDKHMKQKPLVEANYSSNEVRHFLIAQLFKIIDEIEV